MIRFVNPNYHVILIHYPLALLGLGLLIEIFGFLWPRSTFRIAGRWMVLIGALACAPAATSGIFAKYDAVQKRAGDLDGIWADVVAAAHLTALQWKYLNLHVLCSAIGAGVAVLGAIFYLASSIHFPDRIPWPILGVFLAAMGLMTIGAYNAGEIIARTQFSTQSQTESDKLESQWQRDTAAAPRAEKLNRQIDYYIDPLQAHIIGAGIVFALAAAALGFSLHRSRQLTAVKPAAKEAKETDAPPVFPSPAARFWAVTAAVGLGVVAGGWYVFARDLPTPLWDIRAAFHSEIWKPYQLNPMTSGRPLMHLILGSAIILTSLLFIPLAAWSARRRLVISLLGVLVLLMIAAQIGVGILMLYDTDSGPLYHFNATESSPAYVSAARN